MADDIKYCIYSGDGSHRTDWKNQVGINGVTYVASDSYDNAKFKSDAAACAKAGVDRVEKLKVAV